jgi:hypothetical protein
MRRRILATYAEASAEDILSGIEWYGRAESAAAEIAEGTELSTRTVAGIIAALSPRNNWRTNLAWAAAVVEAYAEGATNPPNVHTRAMRAQAWRIASGEDPLDVLNGPKVRAFFANITGDHEAVTVDVWAARIAEGTWTPHPTKRTLRDWAAEPAPQGSRYTTIARAYREAAHIIGRTPREVQAAVWVHVRGTAD